MFHIQIQSIMYWSARDSHCKLVNWFLYDPVECQKTRISWNVHLELDNVKEFPQKLVKTFATSLRYFEVIASNRYHYYLARSSDLENIFEIDKTYLKFSVLRLKNLFNPMCTCLTLCSTLYIYIYMCVCKQGTNVYHVLTFCRQRVVNRGTALVNFWYLLNAFFSVSNIET